MAKLPKVQPKVVDFKVGDTVFVNNAQTGDKDIPGTIVAASKGWFNVQILAEVGDDNEQIKPISARAGSLKERVAASLPVKGADDDSGLKDDLEPESEDVAKGKSRMAAVLNEARKGYVHAKRPDGRSTSNNGDAMARALLEMDPVQVIQLAEVICNIPAGDLVAKYEHLNPGQKRMNAGNRIRATVRHMNDIKANSSEPSEIDAAMVGLDRIDTIVENPFDVLAVYAETEVGELVKYPTEE